MRFDTAVQFEKIILSDPDPTGNRQKSLEVVEIRYGSVTNSALESIALTDQSAGVKTPAALAQSGLTVRIQGWMNHSFDQIRIAGRVYRVLSRRKLRRIETFIVTEVL